MEGLTIKQAMKKGKAKLCSAEKCSQLSREICSRCSKPSCKFHMCARIRNDKKIKICDKCNYAEIKEQIEAENNKERKIAEEKLISMNEQNKGCIEDAKIDDKTLEELEGKINEIEKESELKSQFRQEEIRKEKYLKEKNLNVLSNLKSAIDNSAEIYKTENEKLVQAKSQVTTLEIDLNQLNSAIKDQQALIKSLRESADNCITQEKFLEALCPKCIARARGISFISPINAFQSEKDHESKACSRCRII